VVRMNREGIDVGHLLNLGALIDKPATEVLGSHRGPGRDAAPKASAAMYDVFWFLGYSSCVRDRSSSRVRRKFAMCSI
jgi:hypothetical protein